MKCVSEIAGRVNVLVNDTEIDMTEYVTFGLIYLDRVSIFDGQIPPGINFLTFLFTAQFAHYNFFNLSRLY